MSAGHELNDDSINTNALVKYTPTRQAEFKMALSRESTKPLKLDADISLHYPGREMRLKESLEEKQPQEYHHSLELTLAKYQEIRVNSVYKMNPRHELTAEVNLPSMEPITLSGHFNPVPTNIQLHGETSYASRTYLLDFNSQHAGNAKRYTSRSNMELSWPERQVLGTSEFTRDNDVYTLNIENKWDARRDESQKFTLNSQVTAVMAAPVIAIKTTWPGQFINLDVNGQYATTGWFKSAQDLEGAITMTSNIPYMEQVSGSFKYDHGPANVKTSGEISWAEGQKITTDLSVVGRNSWTGMDFVMSIGTPFRGFRTMRGESTYNFDGKTLTSNNKVSWERKSIAVDVSHTPRNSAYNGEIKITTPFEAFEIMSATVGHRWNGQQMDNTFEAALGEKKISLVHNMEHARQGYSVNNKGSVTLTTPFREVQQARVSWSHENNARTLRCHSEIEYNNQKGMFDIDGTHQVNNRKRAVELTASLKTPFEGTEDLSMNIKHEHQRKSWEGIKTEVTAGPISYSHEVDISMANSAAKVKFTSPFRNFERMMLKSELKNNGDSYETSHLVRWGANNKMTLDGNFAYQGEFGYTTSVSFASPFTYAERLAFNSNFNCPKQTEFVFHADAEYGADYRYVIDRISRINRESIHEEFSIETPHEALRNMKLIQDTTGGLRNFVHTKDFTLNGDQSILKVISNNENIDNIIASVELTTPYSIIRRAKIDATHKRDGNTYTTAANIDVPKYSGTARHEMTINSATDFSSNSVVTYLPGQDIAVTTSFALSPKVEGSITFSSPFQGFERHSLSFTHSGRLTNFKTGVEMVNNGRMKTNFDAEFVMHNNIIKTSARFTSPLRQVERIAAAFNHKGPLDNCRTDLNLEFNNERMNLENDFSLEGTTMKTKTVVNTPFEAFRTGSIEVNHAGGPFEFRNDASINMAGHMINLNSQFDGTSGNIHMDTTFHAVSNIDVKFEHTGPFKNFRNSATASFNRHSINANSEFNFRRMTGKIHLDTPMDALRNIDLAFEHNGGLTNFNNEATLNVNQQVMKVTGRLSDSPLSATIRVETPFELRSTEISFTHEGADWTKFRTTASLSYNDRQINANTAFDWDVISGSFHIDTPYTSFSNLDVSFEHNGKNWRNFENNALFELNGMKYTGNSEFRWFGKAFRAKASIKGQQEYSIKINHKGGRYDFNNKAQVSLAGTTATFVSDFKWEGENIDCKVEITPAAGNGGVLTFTHKGPKEDFSSTIEGKSGRDTFTLALTHKGTLAAFESALSWVCSDRYINKFDAFVKHNGNSRDFTTEFGANTDNHRLEVKTQYAGNSVGFHFNTDSTKLDIEAEHNGPWKKFKNSASITYNRRSINANSQFNLRKMSGKFHLDTPVYALRNVDLSFTHDGRDLTNFNNEAILNLNRQEMKVTSSMGNSPLSGNLKLETPFEPVRNIETSFSHEGAARNFRNSGSFIYNGAQIKANSALNLNHMTGSMHIDTPYRPFNNFDASFQHNGEDWRSFNNEGSVDVNGMKYDAKTAFNADGSGSFQINTPHNELRSLDVSANHKGNDWGRFENSGAVIYNGQKYDAKSTFNANSGSVNLQVNTPHSELRSLEVSGNHNGNHWRIFDNAGSVTYNGQKYDVKTNFNADGGYGTFQVNTPHREFRSLDVSVNHAGNDLSNFENTGTVTYNGQKYQTKTTFDANGPSGAFKLETPHREVRNLDVDFQHNGRNWRNWENSANVDFNGQRYAGDANFKWTRGLLRSGAKVQIPEEYSFRLNHKGDLTDFNNKATVRVQGDNYVAGSSFKLDGENVDASANVETPHQGYKTQKLTFAHRGNQDEFETTGVLETNHRSYPRFDFKVNHKGGRKINTNAEVNTPIPGYERFTAGLNHVQRRKSIETVATVETPFPGYEKFGVNLDHDGHAQDFKTNLKMQTPWRNYESFGVAMNHAGDLSSFETSTTIDLPCESVPRVTVTLKHNGGLTDFTTTAAVEYNSKKIEGTVGFKKSSDWSAANYEALLRLKSPCPLVQDLSIVAAHNRKTDVKTGSLDIDLNGEKKCDFDYSYNTNGFRNVRVTIREPRAMETEVNIRDPSRMAGDASINWNTKEMDANARFEFAFKNIRDVDNVDQELTLKSILPRRTVGITIGHIRTPSRYNRNAEVVWGNDPASRVTYDFDINTSQRRSQNMLDGSFKVNTPVYDFVGSFSHKTIPGVQYTTEVTLETGERLTFKNDLLMTKPGFKHTISVNHPAFSKVRINNTNKILVSNL